MQFRGLLLGFSMLAALVIPCAASAHIIGKSWNVPSGAYTVDIGYTPTTFSAGQYSVFNFQLWKGQAATGTPETFAQVWVRITSESDGTLLATGVWAQPVGPTTLLYEFQKPGSYKLETSYRDESGNDIAVASIPITVDAAPGTGGGLPVGSFGVPLVALLAGGAVGAFAVRARSRR